MKKNHLKSLLLFVSICFSESLFSQGIGINTAGSQPSGNAVLDLNTGNSYNRGIIIPHVELSSSLLTFGLAGSVSAKDSGMMVYNSISTRQPVGYYYWNGTTWVGVVSGTSGWTLTGNSGTTVGTNFIGTNDANALEFKVDGQKAGWIDYTSSGSTSLGWEAANSISTGINNTAVGYKASYTNSSASRNTAVGAYAMYLNTGSGNTAVGDTALYNNTANYNTGIGAQALQKNTSGNGNSALGYMAGWKCANGAANTFIGFEAGYLSTNASNITAVGEAALWDNTAGNNTAVGYGALQVNTTGTNNTAMGCQALGSGSTTATGLSAYGNHTLYNNTGSSNTAIGDSAGISNTSGTNNTFIGRNSNAGSGTLTNATALGYGSTVSASNTVKLGNNTIARSDSSFACDLKGTTVSGSTSGTANFKEVEAGNGEKKVLIYVSALKGTASYTFPTAFSVGNDYTIFTNATGVTVTSLSNTSITISGPISTPSGIIIVDGY